MLALGVKNSVLALGVEQTLVRMLAMNVYKLRAKLTQLSNSAGGAVNISATSALLVYETS